MPRRITKTDESIINAGGSFVEPLECRALMSVSSFLPVLNVPVSPTPPTTPSAPVSAIYIKIPGITGSSTTTGFAGDIKASSFTLSTANRDATFTKSLDRTSPHLSLNADTGRLIPSLTVSFTRQVGGRTLAYLTETFSKVIITNDKFTGGTSPTESVTFNYAKIAFRYTIPSSPTPVVGPK